MNLRKIIVTRVALGLSGLSAVAIFFFLTSPSSQPKMPALGLLPPAKKLGTQGELTPDKISALLNESSFQPISSSTSVVQEPDLPAGVSLPNDVDILGYGNSKFLVDTKWATIRFVGDSPAGAGLTGAELNRAQMDALGSVRDTIPVVTTAQTITEMMEQYFAPLLRTLPRGDDILARIKVQGAYFSPRSAFANNPDSERDNAFIMGVQSLYIYPNSCFDKTSADICSPVGYTAGHDPTIIGHELSHVIFNHLRDERSLEGWQWFAVNEGYADFFSASYFGDPILGRIWRVTRPSGARYLRRLLDTPTTNDAKALEEGHSFGSVWSSALWRSRNQIAQTFKVKTFEFDRVALMSIHFLGESTKTKLGDAAAAMLKAADVLGYSAWKNVLLEEFKKSEVELARGSKISAATGETIETQQGGVKCGQISTLPHQQPKPASKTNQTSVFWLFLTTPLFIYRLFPRRLRLRRFQKFLLLAIATLPLNGCQLSSLWQSSESKPGGLAIVYQCNLSNLRDGTPVLPSQRSVTFTFSDSAPADSRSEQIFVGDERFENGESSLLLIVDKSNMRIDQFRKRDGSLFQINLGQKYFSSEDALAVQNMRLATIIIEGAARAWQKERNQNNSSSSSTTRSAVRFDVTGTPAVATVQQDIIGARGFGPLANEITLNGVSLCTYQKTTR